MPMETERADAVFMLQLRSNIFCITASKTTTGGSYSPDSHRLAVLSSRPPIAANCAAVFVGHKSLQTAPNFVGGTTVSLPGMNCPWISRAVTFGFPNSARMTQEPQPNTPLTVTTVLSWCPLVIVRRQKARDRKRQREPEHHEPKNEHRFRAHDASRGRGVQSPYCVASGPHAPSPARELAAPSGISPDRRWRCWRAGTGP